MNRIDHLLAVFGLERRATDYNPAFAPDAWGRAIRGGAYASAGNVLSNSAIAARCVQLRSELLASVPLKMFELLPNGDRRRVVDHPLAQALSDLSNPLMTAFETRELLVRSLDTAGNSYFRLAFDNTGQVIALWPLEASRVQIEQLPNGRLRYRYSSDRGGEIYLQDEILHVRASSETGLVGKSPIAIARGSLSLGLTLNNTAQELAANTFRPHGFLRHPGKLSKTAKDNIAQSILKGEANEPQQMVGGMRVLEEGMEWQRVQFVAEDLALMQSREMSNIDVCHAFGVPPAVLGLVDTVSYGSAAEAARALIQNSLAPLASRVEQAIQRCCLSPEGRRRYFVEHDLRGLTRGNLTERFAAYKIGREIGLYSINELRRAENESAIEGGDDYAPLRSAQSTPAEPIATVKL